MCVCVCVSVRGGSSLSAHLSITASSHGSEQYRPKRRAARLRLTRVTLAEPSQCLMRKMFCWMLTFPNCQPREKIQKINQKLNKLQKSKSSPLSCSPSDDGWMNTGSEVVLVETHRCGEGLLLHQHSVLLCVFFCCCVY